MNLLDKLERKFHRFCIPHLTYILIIGQVIVFFLDYAKVIPIEYFVLTGSKVISGEYWRLATFLFIPIPRNIIFAIFIWYLYFLYGSALESTWGTFKYNVYIFMSYILTISISFIMPDALITNAYIYLTIFFAFAYLFPDFTLYIFFVLPIKIKWLAILAGVGYVYILITGTWIARILILISLGNFILFFGKDIIFKIIVGKRKMEYQIKNIKDKDNPFHTCQTCGINDKKNPDMQFRYCDNCDNCYCEEHINNHECIK
jgi:hypothetical protein